MPGWVGTSTQTEDGSFTCTHCKISRRARVTRVGSGRATVLFDKPGKAIVEARQNARAAAQRDLKRARCPGCGRRDTTQALLFWLFYAALTVAAILVGYRYLPMMLYPVVVIGIPLYAWRSWSTIDRGIVWL